MIVSSVQTQSCANLCSQRERGLGAKGVPKVLRACSQPTVGHRQASNKKAPLIFSGAFFLSASSDRRYPLHSLQSWGKLSDPQHSLRSRGQLSYPRRSILSRGRLSGFKPKNPNSDLLGFFGFRIRWLYLPSVLL